MLRLVSRRALSSVTPRARYLAALTATAAPRVTDDPAPVARQLSVRLLDTYGADRDSVKGHAA